MPNVRPVDSTFLGSFPSAAELERRYPAAQRSGAQATVVSGGLDVAYASNGASWKLIGGDSSPPAIGMGAAGQNVYFKNGQTNICWSPVWQGQSKDGTVLYPATTRVLGASQIVNELNGVVNAGGAAIPYTVTDTITQAMAGGAGGTGVSFTQVVMVPGETYGGNIAWSVKFQSSGIEVANIQITTGVVNGTSLTIPFDFPLEGRVNDVFVITMTKADGTTLLAKPGLTNGTQPYRQLTYRTFTDTAMGSGGAAIASPDTLTTLAASNSGILARSAGLDRLVLDAASSALKSPSLGSDVTIQANAYQVRVASSTRFSSDTGSSWLFSPNGANSMSVSNGQCGGSSSYTNYSDQRLKTGMQAIPDALLDAWRDHVKWGSYQMLSDGPDGRRHIGVYAQDIIAAFTAAGLDWTQWGIVSVMTRPIGDDQYEECYGVSYNDVMAIEHALVRRVLKL